jgi:uncharacterized protein (DUF305 family)
MLLSHPSSTPAALVLTCVLAACSSPRQEPPPTAPKPAAAPFRRPYTEADVRFMSGMIIHHAQAVVMARWAATHNAGPSVQTLAARIVNAQEDEIATMRRWLSDRGLPLPEVPDTEMARRMHPDEHPILMPGMLTEAQMKQLNQSNRAEFDRLFLTFMIQHHRGAVAMVEQLFGTHGAAREETVFKFANDVNVDQSTEIARMERMLAGLFPGSPNQ